MMAEPEELVEEEVVVLPADCFSEMKMARGADLKDGRDRNKLWEIGEECGGAHAGEDWGLLLGGDPIAWPLAR